MIKPISPCLWFDTQAEQAARFYTSIFPNSKIDDIKYFGNEGFDHHGKAAGTVMIVAFQINGQPFTALNGGPIFKLSEATSFQIFCETQDEIDYYWNHLTAGGEEGPCGWLKDQFGLSWQVVPSILSELMNEPQRAERVTKAFLGMKKLDIESLKKA